MKEATARIKIDKQFQTANRELITHLIAKIQPTLTRIWDEEAACTEPQTGVPS